MSDPPASEGFTPSHEGPCEVWCNDVRTFYDSDCAAHYKTAPAELPYDRNACMGSSKLTFYWLAMRSPMWQVYVNCAPLEKPLPLVLRQNTLLRWITPAAPSTPTTPGSFAAAPAESGPSTPTPPSTPSTQGSSAAAPAEAGQSTPSTTTGSKDSNCGSLDVAGTDEDCGSLDVLGHPCQCDCAAAVRRSGCMTACGKSDCGSLDIAGGRHDEQDNQLSTATGSQHKSGTGSQHNSGESPQSQQNTNAPQTSFRFSNVQCSSDAGTVQPQNA
ncbi:unnamed protein product [Phytophthora lilii]|uniref:Unnamed protein product n=1 Tax=Phytophthora lilii TaxID=2077276 RepID=A0A9W6XAT0_9STRA|nr:unnamed protein product [Phytophthora lilii]